MNAGEPFDATGGDKLEITGLRCLVQVEQALTPSPAHCLIRVYGMSLDHINTLTKAGYSFQAANNYVAVQAGDDLTGQATIFNGNIIEAYPDFSEMPDSPFVIVASPGPVIQLKPVKPVSFNGATPVATALQQIIQPAGLTLENNGVNTVLRYPYFPGTVWQQLNRAITAADVFGYHDPMKKLLAIWPKKGSREGAAVLVAPETGMIGYPEFMKNRVRVRTLLDPSFKGMAPGKKTQIKSQLASANGIFNAYKVDYDISSETPGGPWEMIITAAPAGVG